jgi:NAD(P)-dependent dehydrogenase (short-subunit alcohol dehydrogenase family)
MSEDRRTALVTGATSGIGLATATAFSDAGWTVYATGRDEQALRTLADVGCKTRRLEVTDQRAVDRVVDAVRTEAGQLDCLVTSAGYGQYGPVEDVPTARVDAQFDVNVLGVHRVTRVALDLLRESSGTVVLVSSMAASLPVPGAGVYAASKAAVEAMGDALRAELAPHGVDVVLVEPGPVETGFRERRESEMAALEQSDGYESVYDAHRGATTRGALFGDVTPDDVATAVLEVAEADDPPARLPVGWRVRAALAVGKVFPREWVDRLYGRLASN